MEQLAALPTGVRTDDVGRRLASFLATLSSAWEIANPEGRNQLLQQLFRRVVVNNRMAVTQLPRPEVRSFFKLIVSDEITHQRKRRGSLAPIRHFPKGWIIYSAPPPTLPRYTEPRPSKLCRGQVDAIVSAVNAGRTLREIAAEFGISAERVRQLAQARKAPKSAIDVGSRHGTRNSIV